MDLIYLHLDHTNQNAKKTVNRVEPRQDMSIHLGDNGGRPLDYRR